MKMPERKLTAGSMLMSYSSFFTHMFDVSNFHFLDISSSPPFHCCSSSVDTLYDGKVICFTDFNPHFLAFYQFRTLRTCTATRHRVADFGLHSCSCNLNRSGFTLRWWWLMDMAGMTAAAFVYFFELFKFQRSNQKPKASLPSVGAWSISSMSLYFPQAAFYYVHHLLWLDFYHAILHHWTVDCAQDHKRLASSYPPLLAEYPYPPLQRSV